MKSFKAFLDEACWDGYKQVGMKKKGGKQVPNCVPEETVNEKLSVSSGQQAWIDDFLKSDAPQFKGKSKEERVKMAIAAFNAAKKNEGTHGPEGTGHVEKDYADNFAKKKIRLSKHINKDTKDAGLEEEAAANSVAGGGVDMNTTGKTKKMDKRSRFSIEKMFRRAQGVK